MDKGDIRDLPQFEDELKYVLGYLKPNSVTIHQYYQSFFTIEKTKYLLEVINRILAILGDYVSANSQMDVIQEELLKDTVKQAGRAPRIFIQLFVKMTINRYIFGG